MYIRGIGPMSGRREQNCSQPMKRVPVCKFLLDKTLAVVGMIVGAPIMAVIALLIYLDSSGPIIFVQERLGRGGRVFRLYKFRKFPAEWGISGPGVTVAGDLRMTRVGKVLERTKLDELPQLWNILKGDMSFVGPRPESLRYADLFQGEFECVLDYTPGIFGPNQIDFRNESEMYPPDEDPDQYYRRVLFPKKARQDLDYFPKANCLADFAWIIKGVLVSILGSIKWRHIARHHVPVVLLDIASVTLGWVSAVVIRYGWWSATHDALGIVVAGAWFMPLIVIPVMVLGGCYRNTLRHVVLSDILRLATTVSVSWGFAYLALMYVSGRGMSLLLAPLSLMLALSFMVVPRVLYKEFHRRKDVGKTVSGAVPVLIYGTNDRAINLGSLLQRGFPNVRLVGFVDDHVGTRGRSVLDLKILGSERDLPTIFKLHPFEQLWVAEAPDPLKYARLRKWAEEYGVKLVILPAIEAFASLESKSFCMDTDEVSKSALSSQTV